MDKRILTPLLAAMLVLAACAPTAAVPDTDDTMDTVTESSSSSAVIDTTDDGTASSDSMASEGMTASAGSTTSETAEAPGEARVIAMTVTDFEFSPTSVMVKKGENVVIRLTGGEGVHGIAIPGLGINVKINPGETVDIPVHSETAGTFDFFCSVPCGPGHKSMKGSIVVS